MIRILSVLAILFAFTASAQADHRNGFRFRSNFHGHRHNFQRFVVVHQPQAIVIAQPQYVQPVQQYVAPVVAEHVCTPQQVIATAQYAQQVIVPFVNHYQPFRFVNRFVNPFRFRFHR